MPTQKVPMGGAGQADDRVRQDGADTVPVPTGAVASVAARNEAAQEGKLNVHARSKE